MHYTLTVDAAGHVTLPAGILERFGLRAGDKLLLVAQPDGEIKLASLRDQVSKTRGIYQHLVPPGRRIVDELIAERREEARGEELE